jgi:hypothetical protein
LIFIHTLRPVVGFETAMNPAFASPITLFLSVVKPANTLSVLRQ